MKAAKAVLVFGFGVLALSMGLQLMTCTLGQRPGDAEAQSGLSPFVGISENDGRFPTVHALGLTRTGDLYEMYFSEGVGRYITSLPPGNYVAYYNNLYDPSIAVTDDGRAYWSGLDGASTFTLLDEIAPGLIDSPIAFYNVTRDLWIEEDGDVWRDNEYLGNFVGGVVASPSSSVGKLKATYGGSEQ